MGQKKCKKCNIYIQCNIYTKAVMIKLIITLKALFTIFHCINFYMIS